MTAPLINLKILDFSTLLPGPYATMMLADLGAEVLRIEAPGRPGLMRLLPPFDQDGVSAGHGTLNRSKRSLGLNLKTDGALEIIQSLITKQGYNIIVEQMRPGVMDRLGVGYEALKAVCPDIIYCSLTGYGQTGPMRDRAGHDLNYLALSGMLGHYGRNGDHMPPPLPTQVADIGAGSMHLVIGLLSAVIRRTATGEGGHVDISMHDGSVAWNTTMAAETLMSGISAEPEAKPLNGGTFYDLYETSDGKLLSVGSLEPKFWKQFCHAIGRDDLFIRGLNFDIEAQQALKPEIRAAIKSKTLAEWEIIFADYDACVEPVLSTQEALDSAHVRERGMVVDVAGQQQVGTPIRMTGFSAEYKHIGAKLGAHTHQILQSLGYTDDKINQLLQDGVVAGNQ
ncbi:MAG: CaiB/BaiF CoA transferase family protein [Candidatus Promineifilaceae bacterium]